MNVETLLSPATTQGYAGRVALGSTMQPFGPRVPTAETPTLTWAASTGYTGEKSVAWNAAASLGFIDRGAKLEASGAWGLNYPAISGAYTNGYFIEFWHTGTDIAPRFTPGTGTSIEYRVYVDGWAVTDWTYLTAPQTNTFLKINFSTSKTRLIRIYLSANAWYLGLYMPSTGYAYANLSKRFKCAVIGDSYIQGGLAGASGETIVGASDFAMMLSQFTGWDVYSCGVSGTGYCKDLAGGGYTFGSAGRLSQVNALPSDLNLIIAAGSANDTTNGFTNAQIQAAQTALYDALAAARPSVPIVVSGIQTIAAVAGTVAATSAAMKTTALAHPQVRGYIDWTAPSNWLTGTGKSGSENGTGNNDIFTSPDGIHPTRAGAEYATRRTVDALRPIRI